MKGVFLVLMMVTQAIAQERILLVAYDVIRDYYKQYLDFYTSSRPNLTIAKSFGGASKQAIAVRNGLPADVVTLNQKNDITLLVQNGWVDADWQSMYPDNSIPFHTVIVLLVRKGNPKGIRGWADLARNDVKVVFANPKTSGNGRYAYLSLLDFSRKEYGQDANIYLSKVLHNVPVFDAGARAATITFTKRNIGDVLIVPENEAKIAENALGKGLFEVIYPSSSASADVFVAEVQRNTRRHKTHDLTREFISSLWSKDAQRIAAENYFRPNDKTVLAEFAERFPPVKTFNVIEEFGEWKQINREHFADGALFDQLYLAPPPASEPRSLKQHTSASTISVSLYSVNNVSPLALE